MARTDFPNQTFQDLDGSPLVLGYIVIRISNDAMASDGQVCAGMSLTVPLDTVGTVTYIPQVWPNGELTPDDSTYVLEAFRANGQRVLGPLNVTV